MDEINEQDGKHHYKSLTLDVDYYQSLLDDDGIPEDKKRELIETLWQIVVSFVDLGFGIHPLQQTDTDTNKQLHPSVLRMIAEVAQEPRKDGHFVSGRSGNVSEPIDKNQLKETWPEENQL